MQLREQGLSGGDEFRDRDPEGSARRAGERAGASAVREEGTARDRGRVRDGGAEGSADHIPSEPVGILYGGCGQQPDQCPGSAADRAGRHPDPEIPPLFRDRTGCGKFLQGQGREGNADVHVRPERKCRGGRSRRDCGGAVF